MEDRRAGQLIPLLRWPAGFEGLIVLEVLLGAYQPLLPFKVGDPARVYALPIANSALSRRVEKVVAYPPLSELSDLHRRESTRPYSTRTPSRICPANGRRRS
jgi:hypothetical protein